MKINFSFAEASLAFSTAASLCFAQDSKKTTSDKSGSATNAEMGNYGKRKASAHGPHRWADSKE